MIDELEPLTPCADKHLVLRTEKLERFVLKVDHNVLRAAVLAGNEAFPALAVPAHNDGLVAYTGKYVQIIAEILVVMVKRYAGLYVVAGKAERGVAKLYIVVDAAYPGREERPAVLRHAPAAAYVGAYLADY